MKTDNLYEALSRQKFIKLTAFWSGGICVIGVHTASAILYRNLTKEETDIMDDLVDCINPPDDFAGGKDAKVTRFIDQQISSDGYLKKDRDMYKICLPALQKGCVHEYGLKFTELNFGKQIDYLKKIESGVYNSIKCENWGSYSPSSFFEKMRGHCMMGYYGSPKHGGNKNYVSYQMLGLF